jgi:hypothetical protein
MTRIFRTGRVNGNQGADSTLPVLLDIQSRGIQTEPQQKRETSVSV